MCDGGRGGGLAGAGVKHKSLHVLARTCLVLTGRKATPIRREDLPQHSIPAVLTLGRTVSMLQLTLSTPIVTA